MRYFGKIAFTLTIPALLLVHSCASGDKDTGEKVRLRFHPEEGQAYHTSMEVISETKVMGMTMPINFKIDYTILPKEVNDTFSLVEVTYDNVYLKSENPMTGSIEYRSDSPSVAKGMGSERIKEIYDGVVGSSFTAKFDGHGKVVNTEGSSGTLNSGLGSFGPSTDMQEYLETMIATFPAKPVGKGDSWSKTLSSGEDMTVMSTYTVKKVTGKTVELEIEGEVVPSVSDSAENVISVKGTLSGDLVVDRNTGWTRNGTIVQNLTMDVNRGMQTITGTADNKINISTK